MKRPKLSDFTEGVHQIEYAQAVQKYQKALEEYTRQLEEAMQWFCDRVDKGEVRSKKTYARFKELLNPK